MSGIEQLLMAARGHQGLPMQIGGPPPMGGTLPMMGETPAGLPPSATPPGIGGPPQGGSDREVADTAAQHLLEATRQANDPTLKAALSVALAALHKYTAQIDKEHHQALGGKLSPRLMAQAHRGG